MDDAWETAHGLDPLLNDAGLDLDSDGFVYTAFTLLGSIGDEAVVTGVARFNAGTGRFERARYLGCQVVGTDFPILPGAGYIVHMTQAPSWEAR